mmetsp:Transcript_4798/g.10743  ORF Transcript_4798/g.10743 Transcript_4798/m.10743 type:complete len:207 (-) Transcript_4798:992-1612(-)
MSSETGLNLCSCCFLDSSHLIFSIVSPTSKLLDCLETTYDSLAVNNIGEIHYESIRRYHSSCGTLDRYGAADRNAIIQPPNKRSIDALNFHGCNVLLHRCNVLLLSLQLLRSAPLSTNRLDTNYVSYFNLQRHRRGMSSPTSLNQGGRTISSLSEIPAPSSGEPATDRRLGANNIRQGANKDLGGGIAPPNGLNSGRSSVGGTNPT